MRNLEEIKAILSFSKIGFLGWRLPDLKKVMKTIVCSSFFKILLLALSGPKLVPCWLNCAQVSSKLAHLGPKLAPSWLQVGTKLAPKLAQDGPR